MAIRIIAAGLLLALALAGCGAATAPVGQLPSATAGSARSPSPTVAATASPEPATPSQEERVSPTDDPTPVPSQSATPTAATSTGQAAAPATPVFQATPLVPDSAPTPAAATPPGFDKLVHCRCRSRRQTRHRPQRNPAAGGQFGDLARRRPGLPRARHGLPTGAGGRLPHPAWRRWPGLQLPRRRATRPLPLRAKARRLAAAGAATRHGDT